MPVPPSKGSPWPLPKIYSTSPISFEVDVNNFQFLVSSFTCDLLEDSLKRYYQIIFNQIYPYSSFSSFSSSSSSSSSPFVDHVTVTLLNPCSDQISLQSDESYELKVFSPTSVSLVAKEIWGILRGLETFSQIIYQENFDFKINKTTILDSPRFQWRGILIDTSRHFLPIQTIFNILDGMSYNKMNVFHWHVVDDQSFPYQSFTFPQLSKKGSYKRYSHEYTQPDVEKVVEFGKGRGIRVVPEFDTPGHVESWGKGQPDLITPCHVGGKPSGEFGPINVARESSFTFVSKLFKEISKVFPDNYLHLGGDEVDYKCWKSNPEIEKFMKNQSFGSDFSKLENYYNQRLVKIVESYNKNYLVWQEVFDNGVELNPKTVVHVWKMGNYSSELYNVTKKGFKALLSSPWYLDYVAYGPIWKNYYNVNPLNFTAPPSQKSLVMGGEACLWGEYIDSTNIHSRLWPSACAVGERLWSDSSVNNSTLAAPRLEEHRCRMLRRGILAGPASGSGFCPQEVAL